MTNQLCPHGWKLSNEPNKLPNKIIGSTLMICPQCALNSSLTQMGSGIILDKSIADELKEKLQEISKRKNNEKK